MRVSRLIVEGKPTLAVEDPSGFRRLDTGVATSGVDRRRRSNLELPGPVGDTLVYDP